MPSVLEAEEPAMMHRTDSDAGNRLRGTMAPVRVAFTWFGTRKSLSAEQKARAAESFGAEGQFLTAGKKLIDTTHPAFKAVTAMRGAIVSYWKGVSLPFPEPGLRLIRQSDIDGFETRMAKLRSELDGAVTELNAHYTELRAAARERLGSLFNPSDYPMTLEGLFGIAWEYPSLAVPAYLERLNPKVYEQECRRVASRFDEAVSLAEDAFLNELNRLVSHLTERLSGSDDGRPKVFRDTAVQNLKEFFTRFQQLNIGSSAELDSLVEQARRILGGVEPQQLRDSAARRQQIVSQLAGVQASVDGLLVDRPQIGRAVQQECRDRSRMPSSA
eukprot:TRINITY_DN643_c0_g1_i3.p1 TRINITY_DN643_c0_g1~~TRINITY_DN643_c0_g1_i3.p1  ORF type:complete len:330 (-),score=67.36 TRINITY_DN643_c0_g1_i3:26-1015(-)